MANSIFEFDEQFGLNSPFGNWLLRTGNGPASSEGLTIRVTRIEGPNVVCAGAVYEYRITGFNRINFVLGEIVAKVKWAYSIDGKQRVQIFPRAEGVVGKHEIRMTWKVPSFVKGGHLMMHSWYEDQETVASTSAEILAYPFLFHKYRVKGRNEGNTAIADDMCYGNGVNRTDHFRYTTAEVESLGLAMQLTLQFPVQALWAQFRSMVASLFSVGELEPIALAMVARFEESSGSEFSHPVLLKHMQKHPSMIQFIKNVENGLRQELKESKGDPSKLLHPSIVGDSGKYGRPQFSTASDTIAGGLRICWNDTWAYEVRIERFDVIPGSGYLLKYRIVLFDHFGLNIEDLSQHTDIYALAGFRAWFALQHIHNFQPFIATAEVVNSITERQ